ncbi:MAG TPA: hypothetical protein VI727_00680 [Candidatus Brocadiaceae bacterium]|nr:hypothetical protein [Candidatus Brocadiaceae bacterium]
MSTFFVCPNCGNDKEFKIFTGSFRAIRQSPESGARTEASGMLPNLRQKDNYVECQLCLKSFEYDSAAIIGKNYIQTIMKLQNKQYAGS